MAHAFVTTASVNAGKLTIRNRERFKVWSAKQKDGEYLVKVERAKATRSLQQLRWYWGCIVEAISDYTGFTPDETHEILKAKFIPKRLSVADRNGEIVGEFVIGGTTTTLSTEEFGMFCEDIRNWAAETLHVVIPDPDPAYIWERERAPA